MRLPTRYFQQPGVRYRVVAPAAGLADAAVSAEHTLRVRPRYRPIGVRSSWAPLLEEAEWRLRPCETFTYRINPMNMPRGSRRDVAGAMARLTRATGIPTKYVGDTTHRAQSAKGWPGSANLVIAWLNDKQSTRRSLDDAAAYGGPIEGYYIGSSNRAEVDKAIVVVKTGLNLRPGFGMHSQGKLLLHELGHVAGLGHVLNRPGQIMSYDSRIGRFEAGDLNGLRQVGRLSGGCPAPTPPENEPLVDRGDLDGTQARRTRGDSPRTGAVVRIPIADLPE